MDSQPPHATYAGGGWWSIHSRAEITQRYEILERIGSGAYSDVYRGRRISDGLPVALKEIHDYESAFREIEALHLLRSSPNVVSLLDYFWRADDDDDAVLVLEFLRSDLSSLVRDAKRRPAAAGGVAAAEAKRWMLQILRGLDACHRNSIVHRDLKPSNLLIGDDGVLKLADFGQARILMQEPSFVPIEDNHHGTGLEFQAWPSEHSGAMHSAECSHLEGFVTEIQHLQEPHAIKGDHIQEDLKAKEFTNETDKEVKSHDDNTSCRATCRTSDIEDDPLQSSYSYEAAECEDADSSVLTSCVGTRWFRAPELLYGSTDYGLEIDLWSLGCIFAELFSLQPLFPGTSDIDQVGRIINVLGNMTEEVWPGCSKLPDFNKIFFNKVENPLGLEACLPNCLPTEINLVKKLVRYDPSQRATAAELLQDSYFHEEPLPVPVNELPVPSASSGWHDESSTLDWHDYNDLDSDSDIDFGGVDVSTTDKGFSIRFS